MITAILPDPVPSVAPVLDLKTIAEVFEITFPINSTPQQQKQICFTKTITACKEGTWWKIEKVKTAIFGLCDQEEQSVFFALMAQVDIATIRQILNQKLQEALSSNTFGSALHEAVRMRNIPLIKLFWKNGANVNAVNSEGMTPLGVAIKCGDVEIVKTLIGNGASIKLACCKDKLLPYAYSIAEGQIECFDTIAAQKDFSFKDTLKTIGNVLHLAILYRQCGVLSHLLTRHYTETVGLIEASNSENLTPLLFAVREGEFESIKILHAKEASLRVTDSEGHSALHLAAIKGDRKIINFLIKNGIDIDLLNLYDKRAADVAKDSTIKSYLNNIHLRNHANPLSKFPSQSPHNLLFIGGDFNDYLGILKELEDQINWKKMKRVGGTLAGGIVAAFFALGLDNQEIHQFLSEMLSKPKGKWKELIENKIFEETTISNFTFGDLERLRNEGKPYIHLHILDVNHHFHSESNEFSDTIISDVLSLLFLTEPQPIYLKTKHQSRYKSVGRILFDKKTVYCPLSVFDHRRYLENGLSEAEGQLIVHNRSTLAIAVRSPPPKEIDRKRMIVIEGKEENDQLVIKKFFKDAASNHHSLFYRAKAKSLVSAVNLKVPLNYFIPRAQPMACLKKALLPAQGWHHTDAASLFVLYGPAGQGKTELACKFANEHVKTFSLIHWIPHASNPESRTESFFELAKILGIPIKAFAKPEELQSQIFFHLERRQSEKPWLLILDDVEQKVDYPERGGFILGISKSLDAWPYKQSSLKMPPLTNDEAICLLSATLSHESERSKTLLIEKFGHSPLMLSMIAAYVDQKNITLAEYLKDVKEDPTHIFDVKSLDRYRYSIKQAWSLTFEQIERKDPRALEWLRILADLKSGAIPEQWLINWLSQIENLRAQPLRDRAREIIAVLCNYALIQYDPTEKTFSLHQFTQEMVKSNYPSGVYSQVIDVLLAEGKLIIRNPQDKSPGKYWMRQAASIGSYIASADYMYAKLGSVWETIGLIKGMYGDFYGAMGAFDLSEVLRPNDEKEKARLKYHKGVAYYKAYVFDKALESFDAAAKYLSKNRLIKALNYQGMIHQQQNNHEMALDCYFRSFRTVLETKKHAEDEDKKKAYQSLMKIERHHLKFTPSTFTLLDRALNKHTFEDTGLKTSLHGFKTCIAHKIDHDSEKREKAEEYSILAASQFS